MVQRIHMIVCGMPVNIFTNTDIDLGGLVQCCGNTGLRSLAFAIFVDVRTMVRDHHVLECFPSGKAARPMPILAISRKQCLLHLNQQPAAIAIGAGCLYTVHNAAPLYQLVSRSTPEQMEQIVLFEYIQHACAAHRKLDRKVRDDPRTSHQIIEFVNQVIVVPVPVGENDKVRIRSSYVCIRCPDLTPGLICLLIIRVAGGSHIEEKLFLYTCSLGPKINAITLAYVVQLDLVSAFSTWDGGCPTVRRRWSGRPIGTGCVGYTIRKRIGTPLVETGYLWWNLTAGDSQIGIFNRRTSTYKFHFAPQRFPHSGILRLFFCLKQLCAEPSVFITVYFFDPGAEFFK